MRIRPQETGILHFTGIGGIGMSGIAEVLHALGYKVQGSDIAESANVQRLRDKGIEIAIGHDAKNVEGVALIVVSSAVKRDNPEIIAARAARLPIVRRADMLAELMRLKRAIAIGGTHGKTTTTSMVGAMLEEGGFDPTVINGGIVNKYGTNTRLGDGEWMVAESDESDGSFTRLPATVVVVTNIDPEHMEHYGDFDHVRAAYAQFVENVPFYGYAVLCSDHPEVQALIPLVSDRRLITYGFNPQADVRAHNLRPSPQGCNFDVIWTNGPELHDVWLPMPGDHNVQNALAALAIGQEMGIAAPVMKKALAHFSGVKRRFTKTGETHGVTVIDDYGHHPVEIAAVLKAARGCVAESGGRVIAVVQPHRYSRLSSLFEGFCTCFNDADSVIVADVYAAGEKPIDGAGRDALADGIRRHGHKDVRILNTAADLPQLAADMAQQGDFIICLGAGDITKWAGSLPGELEKIFAAGKVQRA
jgi:UDP-N-acetylmuramate--alanine ligase